MRETGDERVPQFAKREKCLGMKQWPTRSTTRTDLGLMQINSNLNLVFFDCTIAKIMRQI